MGHSTILVFFKGTLEKGVKRCDEYVKALVDSILLREHTAAVGCLGDVSGVREHGCRAWVGWGGK